MSVHSAEGKIQYYKDSAESRREYSVLQGECREQKGIFSITRRVYSAEFSVIQARRVHSLEGNIQYYEYEEGAECKGNIQ